MASEPFVDIHRHLKPVDPVCAEFGLWVCSTKCNRIPNKYPNYEATPLSNREYFSITHILEGKAALWSRSSGTTQEAGAGQCVMIPPREIVRYGKVGTEPYREDVVCYAGPVAELLRRNGMIGFGVFDFSSSERPLLSVINASAAPNAVGRLTAGIRLLELLQLCYESACRTRFPMADRLELLLERLQSEKSYVTPVTEMAAFCGLSENYFRVIFERRTGFSPKKYLERMRLSHAVSLLLESGESIASIATMLGYRDPFHFSSRFKAATGLSPEHYRRAHLPAE